MKKINNKHMFISLLSLFISGFAIAAESNENRADYKPPTNDGYTLGDIYNNGESHVDKRTSDGFQKNNHYQNGQPNNGQPIYRHERADGFQDKRRKEFLSEDIYKDKRWEKSPEVVKSMIGHNNTRVIINLEPQKDYEMQINNGTFTEFRTPKKEFIKNDDLFDTKLQGQKTTHYINNYGKENAYRIDKNGRRVIMVLKSDFKDNKGKTRSLTYQDSSYIQGYTDKRLTDKDSGMQSKYNIHNIPTERKHGIIYNNGNNNRNNNHH